MNKHIFQTVLLLMLALFGSTSLLRADELTVYDGTSYNSYVPIYGYYADAYLRCQYVIPAEYLEDMKGSSITELKYYLRSTTSVALTGTFQIYLAEVNFTNISAFYTGNTTVVYEGTVNTTASEMTIVFNNGGFIYEGSNLLIGFDQIACGNYKSCSFYGQSVTGACVQGYNSASLSSVSPTQRNFIPKTTFTYEAVGNRYTITATSNPEGVGTIIGPGLYNEGAECTLKASCSEQYYFINWTQDGVEVSTEPEYTFEVTGDAEFVANFGENEIYEITASAENEQHGSVAGGGNFYANQVCVLRAAGKDNYLFTNWTLDGEEVSTNPVYSFAVTGDAALVANFAEFDTKLLYNGTMTDMYFPLYGWGVSQYYSQAQYVMPDYDLTDMVGKSIKGMRLYLQSYLEEAYFDSQVSVYISGFDSERISQFIDPLEATTVYSGMVNISQDEMTIVFDTPYDYLGGHLLIGINNVELGTNNLYTSFICVDKRDACVFDYNETADNFQPIQRNKLPKTTFFFDDETAPVYVISATMNIEAAGTVTGGGIFSEGQTCTLTASKNYGYKFVNWTLDGEEVSTDPVYTFVVNGNGEYVANFAEVEVLQVEHTVYEGTDSNDLVPLYIYYFDSYTRSQYVIPAADLEGIAGGTINAVRYYSNGDLTFTTGCMVDVYLKEVDYTAISAFEPKASAQLVYKGFIYVVDGEVLITFNTPYEYHGGNLLIGTENLSATGYKMISFYGTNVTGASVAGQNSGGTASVAAGQQNFIPKTTFYAEVDGDPANLTTMPSPLALGYRPIGAWMKPFGASITNQGGATNINDIYVDNDYFQLGDINVPFMMQTGDTLSFPVKSNFDEEGVVNATMYVNYSNGKMAAFDMNAIAYNPVEGDVWENPMEVVVPYVGNAPVDIHHNYDIPGGTSVANDAVYKVDIDQLSMLNVTTGDVPSAFAVYTEEGFDGVGGPDLENTYQYAVQTVAVGDTFTEDFEGGIPDGWSVIDANGDGYTWTAVSEVPSVWPYYASMELDWYRTGTNSMVSGSYLNGVGAITPNDYLVTPLVAIANGSVFSFWAAAVDMNFAAEHFGVAVSTDGISFTMLDEWTMTAKGRGNTPKGETVRGGRALGNWYQYTVDLSAYAGQSVYIAIRHFNCYDQYILSIDDAELSMPNAKRDAAMSNGMAVAPGTYYVVVAAEGEEFPVNIELNDVPAPVAAELVTPANEATNVMDPCVLSWTLGNYTQEMQVLFGTQYPPTDVLIDWTDELVASTVVPELAHNTMYFVQINERNYTGTTESEIFSFTSYLEAPEVYADNWYVYEGDDIRFYWNAIEDEGLLSYNVYLNGTFFANTTDTEFILPEAEYNLNNGYLFQVTAVYGLGESGKESFVFFYVGGYGNVAGHVYEQDGETPIAEATVVLYGNDVFGEYNEFVFATDEEGAYSGTLYMGEYYGLAWKDEYQYAEHEVIFADHDFTIEGVDFVMHEEYTPVAEVIVEDEGTNAQVEWTLGEGNRSLQYFNVYRKGAYDDNYELLADSILEHAYADGAWAELPMGAYRYGVSAIYEGNHVNNRNRSDVVDFDEGLPEGWATIDADGDGYNWRRGSEILTVTTEIGHEGSVDMMLSQSWDNIASALNPDNYLVTPLVPLGGTFKFWACSQDENWSAEHFGVAVSTVSQTDASSFTTIQEWTITAKGNGQTANTRGNRTPSQWIQYSVDLGAYNGQRGYIAIRHFNCTDQYYLNVDDVEYPGLSGGSIPTPPATGLNESAITWSEIINKDMYLGEGEMSLTVTLNSGDSPEGVYVNFINLDENEQAYYPVEEVILDETGTYTWDNFRKGYYLITLTKEGYETVFETLAVFEPTALTYVMVEEIVMAEDLYVSPTAWARWDDAVFDVTANPTTFTEGFEEGIPTDWTVIDADEDGCTWTTMSQIYNDWNTYAGDSDWAHSGSDAALSASWIDSYGAMYPDNYLVTPRVIIGEGSTLSFWAAACDPVWAEEHFGVFVSTTTLDPKDFVEVQSWTLAAKETGSWNNYSIDLNEYANKEVYIAFRHFDCFNMYVMSIDDVELTWEPQSTRHYMGYNVIVTDLAGEEVYNGETTEMQMQLPVENLVAGETYRCMVANRYSTGDPDGYTGLSDYITTEFVYVPCDEYAGVDYAVAAQTENGNLINWAYPEDAAAGTIMGVLLYRDGELMGLNRTESYLEEEATEMQDYSLRVVYSDYAMSCEQEVVATPRYSVTAVSNYESYGNTTGSGVYFENTPCTLEAFASNDYDYTFLYWTKDGEIVSMDAEYTFTVTENAEYVANFMSNNNNWGVDPANYPSNMTVTGIIVIDGVEQEGANALQLELGAFVGDECRGNARLEYTDFDHYMVFMTIYGDAQEPLSFKLYNHRTEMEVPNLMCSNEMNFVADETLGTMLDPYVFEFFSVVTVNYEFTSGWNWWATHIEMDGVNGMAMLQEGLGENATQISSQTAFTNYYAGYGWYGSLTTLNNESMYRVNMSAPVEFPLTGREADPALHPISITNGWNHIGFISATQLSVGEALADLTPSQGDVVKNQKAYANYYQGYGWYGSLNTIKPGEGLMYKSVSNETLTFTYPSGMNNGKDELAENLTGDNNHWVPNVYAYPSNMNVMAVVELDDVELASDEYELAVFANGECRGSIRLIYAEPLNRYVAFLTVSGEEASELTFGLYNATTGEECFDSATNLTFMADAMVGDPNEPFKVSFKGGNGFNEFGSAMRLYPNPAAKGEKIHVQMSTDNAQKVRIEILDAMGKTVATESSTVMPTSINVPGTAGVYTVRIITEGNGVMIQKLIVK